MAVSGVTFRYQFGVALDEQAFNTVSAGLRVTRPELFAYSTDVVVKPADPGPPPSPAHVLTIYAMVDDPLSFNLYPIAGRPDLPPDSLLIGGDILFSLTDNLLGTITRIGATIQAVGNIAYSGGNAVIKLLDFKITDLRGEQPVLAIGGGAAAGAPAGPPAVPDPNLEATFQAIINYLMELYIGAAIEKTVTGFPVPSLDKLIKFDKLGKLPLDGLFIRNKALYVMFGDDLNAPTTFPQAPPTPVDLRIGVSQSGLRRVVSSFLPIPISLEIGHDYTVFHLTSSNLEIPEIDFRLQAGATRFPAAIHVSGLLNLRVKLPIPILGGNLVFDLPLPLDSLTQYAGQLWAYFAIDPPTDADPGVHLRIAPDVDLLDDWYVLVVPNFRDFLARAFRNAVDHAADQLLGKTFCNIPVIGWIVCGTIDVTAQVLGWLIGAGLDWCIGTMLTTIVNTIGRIALQFIDQPSFQIFHMQQADLKRQLGVTIQSAGVEIIDNGRDADLQVDAYFSQQGLPVPAPPAPLPPPQVPQPPPTPGFPGVPTLPIYDAAAFVPAAQLPAPAWVDGTHLKFNLTAQSRDHGSHTGACQVDFSHAGGKWLLTQKMLDAGGNTLALITSQYDDSTFKPLRAEHASIGTASTVRQIVDFTVASDHAVASLGIDGGPNLQMDEVLRVGIALEFEDAWIFRFAQSATALAAGSLGHFGKIAVVDPHSALNWVREIPVAVTIQSDTYNWAPAGGAPAPVPVWTVTATDELRTTVGHIAKDGSGLLHLHVQIADAATELIRV